MARRLSHTEAAAVMLEAKLRPLEEYPGARKKWRSECLVCGQVVTPTYANVRRRGAGCLNCRNAKIGQALRGDADKAVEVMIAAGLQPLAPYRNVDTSWRSLCLTCGKTTSPTLWSVKSRGTGCGFCAGNRIDPDDARRAMLAAGVEPLGPYPGKAVEQWPSRCMVCDREVSPRYNAIQQGQGGCGYCAGNRVDPREAVATMRAAGVEPLETFRGGHMPWRCRCNDCELEVFPTYSSVNAGRGGCRYCGHEKTAAARRIDADEAVAMMRTAGLEPLVEYPGVREPWHSRCLACGNGVSPRLDGIKNRGQGACIFCAASGYKPDDPGSVYLVTHRVYSAVKVGVRNLDSYRLRDHERYGWELIEEWQFGDGGVPLRIESSVLDWWRGDLNASVACTPSELPQGGYTETASTTDVSQEATQDYISRMVASIDS